MSMEVLQSKSEIAAARKQLRKLGADAADPAILALLKRNRLWPGKPLGDQLKSWDIWKTVSFVRQHLQSDAALLDLGAFCCEVLPALYLSGYRRLTGVDLNPDLTLMPYREEIRYLIGNFLETTLPDGSFDAITAISVIEHGYQPERLFSEVARLLKSGGYFIASLDYWPDKIESAGIQVFGLDWLIFSQKDMNDLFATARSYGLEPVGELNSAAGTAPVSWQSRNYTFAWIVLRKG